MKVRKPVAIAFAILLLIVTTWSVFNARKAYASSPDAIPKSFGSLKGTMGASLIFEDGSGTIRLVNIDEGKLITIQRR